MSPSEADILLRDVVRFHKEEDPVTKRSRLTDPGTFLGPGQAPRLRQYIQGCSYVNLCKLVYIEVTNKVLYDLWGNVLEHRSARKGLEGYLGTELTSLTELAHKVLIPQPEIERLQELYMARPGGVYANICQFYPKGKCLKGDRCSYIHAEHEGNDGRNPSPSGQD